MKIKILKPIGKELPGLSEIVFDKHGIPLLNIIEIQTDKNGIPLEKFWRDRFADAKFDQCICIHKTKGKGKDTVIGEIPIHGESCECGVCSREKAAKSKKKGQVKRKSK